MLTIGAGQPICPDFLRFSQPFAPWSAAPEQKISPLATVTRIGAAG
jgi:hypothetical protein